jgi:hypothetical protein
MSIAPEISPRRISRWVGGLAAVLATMAAISFVAVRARTQVVDEAPVTSLARANPMPSPSAAPTHSVQDDPPTPASQEQQAQPASDLPGTRPAPRPFVARARAPHASDRARANALPEKSSATPAAIVAPIPMEPNF